MRTGETIIRSPLDKPLPQLTEEDISQLTREDCRRYLKEKGMRRPSWNKSQAIEQVISLKTLLEARTESDTTAGIRQRVHISQPENLTQVVSVERGSSSDLQVSVSANETVSYRRKDSPKPDTSCRVTVPENNTDSPRNMSSTNGLVGQMTIFYCGKVNVYDSMPADKVLAILQLAAGHINLPQDSPPAGTAAVRSFACQLQATSTRSGLVPSAAVSPSMHNAVAEYSQQYREEGTVSGEVEPDGSTSRKASVRRYLEKRKDRGRFKAMRKVGPPSSLEMYLNHQVTGQNPNEQSSRSETCSPPQPRPPHTPTRCSSVENQAKNTGLSVDLNDTDVQEA